MKVDELVVKGQLVGVELARPTGAEVVYIYPGPGLLAHRRRQPFSLQFVEKLTSSPARQKLNNCISRGRSRSYTAGCCVCSALLRNPPVEISTTPLPLLLTTLPGVFIGVSEPGCCVVTAIRKAEL